MSISAIYTLPNPSNVEEITSFFVSSSSSSFSLFTVPDILSGASLRRFVVGVVATVAAAAATVDRVSSRSMSSLLLFRCGSGGCGTCGCGVVGPPLTPLSVPLLLRFLLLAGLGGGKATQTM